AQLSMLAWDAERAVEWGKRAITIAERIGDTETLVHALNNVGTAQLPHGEDEGREHVERSLALALSAGLEDHAARAYTNLGSGFGEIYQFDQAVRYLRDGITYCRERDLDTLRIYMSAWLALVYCYQGRWSDAVDQADLVLRQPGVSTISRIMALVALGRIRARRGDPQVQTVLDQALELALPTGNVQRLGPVRAARAEAAWLAGDRDGALSESRAGLALAMESQQPWLIGELGLWYWLAGDRTSVPDGAAEPFSRQMQGDWQGAADTWIRLGCPYEAARALMASDQASVVQRALTEFLALDARPAAAATRHQLRQMGVRDIPRGPRPLTRAHPAHLTAREVEVLDHIAVGDTNADIAAKLYLSRKTIEQHASSIFKKLGVTSRREAVQAARQQGLIP
ncbi:MAG TPA: helix-turn-helix transcriptional regulator, partial [Thermomicrobiales bacterium]|nr:helix-turn-helix transcriptional regulator [Thermomicrobiales bacterium]